jgi:uncharacterized protein (TIGR04255 family)
MSRRGEATVPLVLTEREREILAGNRLKVVVAQVKFPPVHALNTSAGVAPFQDAIREWYPIAADRGHQVTLKLSTAGFENEGSQPGPWRFLTEDSAWTVALAPDSLSLETTSYLAYEDFQERFVQLLAALVEIVRPARLDRFGFRFLNELALANVRTLADWRPFIGEDLLALTGSGALSEKVTFAVQQVNLELDDGKIILKHGYSPREPGADTPSVYVIDIDTFDDRPMAFDSAEVVRKMDLYNGWAWNLFRANVRDELVAELRGTRTTA